MPKIVFFDTIRYDDGTEGKKRMLEFFPTEGHELFLSSSKGREHGPGIIRDGIGPPRMQLASNPWESTTDAEKQREGTWDIFSDDDQEGNEEYRSHIGEFRKMKPDSELLTVVGFGDLSMNLWNTAFVNSSNSESPKLIYLRDEPVNGRIYSCLIKWRTESGPTSKYSIAPVRFNTFAYDQNPRDPSVVLVNNQPAADKIEFAVFGQQVIRDDHVVSPRQFVHQFADIRHLLTLPNLNPKSAETRFFFGAERKDDVWFGEAQLLDDRNLRRAALTGSVELNRLYKGLGCPKDYLESVLNRYGKFVNNETFRSLEPGEWRWIPEDDNLVEIYLRRNTYPCTMLGVTTNGNIISLAWKGKYDTDGGWTIEGAAQALKDHGVRDAILCDEGADVMQHTFDQHDDSGLANSREQLRSVLIFAK